MLVTREDDWGRVSIPNEFYFFYFFTGTVYFRAEEKDGILLMSAFCVYCCASPLFLSSVLMAHLNKVLDVSEASSTNPEATRSTTRCYVTSHWHEEWVNKRNWKTIESPPPSWTNLTYLFWDLFSFSFNLRWPRNKSLYFPLSFFSLIFLLGFRPLILPSFFHPVRSSNPSLLSLTRPSIHFPRTSPTHSFIHSSTPTSIFNPLIHLSS